MCLVVILLFTSEHYRFSWWY